eukprot:6471555-Amphidinium_carterae.1
MVMMMMMMMSTIVVVLGRSTNSSYAPTLVGKLVTALVTHLLGPGGGQLVPLEGLSGLLCLEEQLAADVTLHCKRLSLIMRKSAAQCPGATLRAPTTTSFNHPTEEDALE